MALWKWQIRIVLLTLISVSLYAASVPTRILKSTSTEGSNTFASLVKSYSSDINSLLEGVYSEGKGKPGHFLVYLDSNHSLVRRWCNAKLGPKQLRINFIPPVNDLCPKAALPSLKPCFPIEITKPQAGRTLLAISSLNALRPTLQLLWELERIAADFDIIVIDDSSDDGTADYLSRKVLSLILKEAYRVL
jgi:hypothetical protein